MDYLEKIAKKVEEYDVCSVWCLSDSIIMDIDGDIIVKSLYLTTGDCQVLVQGIPINEIPLRLLTDRENGFEVIRQAVAEKAEEFIKHRLKESLG